MIKFLKGQLLGEHIVVKNHDSVLSSFLAAKALLAKKAAGFCRFYKRTANLHVPESVCRRQHTDFGIFVFSTFNKPVMSIEQLHTKGYTVINDVFTHQETGLISERIFQADASKSTFRKTNDLFAIRQFIKEIPGIKPLIFNEKMNAIVRNYFGSSYFIVKSIYFDKPENSNWFVAWHQDLTISVHQKLDLPGFGPWTIKQDQYSVQPPLEMLENIFTIRIHLDDTDEKNGALRIIPGSHLKGIQRYSPGESTHKEEVCNVQSGGVMIMRPLLLHASNRSKNAGRRRVIHIEFSDLHLPEGLTWAELLSVD